MDSSITDPKAPDWELAALREMITSEGFAIFRAHAEQEWGPSGYGRKVRTAIDGSSAVDVSKAVDQVHHGARAVDELFAWLTNRVKTLATPQTSSQPFAAHRRQHS